MRSRRPADVELRARLRDLANQRRRFGYRRLFILLREQGEPSGINRIYRLYSEEGLTVRRRKARRRAIGTRTPILIEAKVNARWSLDFVHDQLAEGRRFRILNIVDDVIRECLAVIHRHLDLGQTGCTRVDDTIARAASRRSFRLAPSSPRTRCWAGQGSWSDWLLAPGRPMQKTTSRSGSTAGCRRASQ